MNETLDAVAPAEIDDQTLRDIEALAQEIADNRKALARDIEGKLDKRSGRRQQKEQEWLRANELYLGNLALKRQARTADNPNPGEKNDSKPQVNIVRPKVQIAKAQLQSFLFPADDDVFDLSPVIPSEVKQAVANGLQPPDTLEVFRQATNGMKSAVTEALLACRFGDKIRQKGLDDLLILGTMVFKAPLNTSRVKKEWVAVQDDTGASTFVRQYSEVNAPDARHVSPWFFYPDDQADDISDCEDAIEVHPMTARDLRDLSNHPGFDSEAIARVLRKGPDRSNLPVFSKRASLTASQMNTESKFVVIEHNGPMSVDEIGKLHLASTHDTKAPADEDEDVIGSVMMVEMWICQGEILRFAVSPLEGNDKLPYCVACWEKDPTSPFGFGLPILLDDAQRVTNASWSMVLDNSGASAGPQMVVDRNRLMPANQKWDFEPFKVWTTTEFSEGRVSDAIHFFNVPNAAGELTQVLQLAKAFGDEESLIPLLTAGMEQPQAAPSTATGGLMAFKAASSLLVEKAKAVTDNVMRPVVEFFVDWFMAFGEDESIKGNFSIDVRSPSEILAKQLEANDLERLLLLAGQNEGVGRVINMDALVEMKVRSMKLPHAEIIKTKQQIAMEDQQRAQQEQQPDAGTLRAQAEFARIELEKEQFAYQQQVDSIRQEAQHRQMVMENSRHQQQIQARFLESEARLQVAFANLQVAIIQASQKAESERERLDHQRAVEEARLALQQFKASQEMVMNAENLQLKRDTFEQERQFASRLGEAGM